MEKINLLKSFVEKSWKVFLNNAESIREFLEQIYHAEIQFLSVYTARENERAKAGLLKNDSK